MLKTIGSTNPKLIPNTFNHTQKKKLLLIMCCNPNHKHEVMATVNLHLHQAC